MNMDYNDIKGDILSHWGQLSEMAHQGDLLTELAESACPVYYSDIMKDWAEMPSEFNDSWQENGIPVSQQTTIFGLMGWDLFFYYESEYMRIYEEIRETKENELENA